MEDVIFYGLAERSHHSLFSWSRLGYLVPDESKKRVRKQGAQPGTALVWGHFPSLQFGPSALKKGHSDLTVKATGP